MVSPSYTQTQQNLRNNYSKGPNMKSIPHFWGNEHGFSGSHHGLNTVTVGDQQWSWKGCGTMGLLAGFWSWVSCLYLVESGFEEKWPIVSLIVLLSHSNETMPLDARPGCSSIKHRKSSCFSLMDRYVCADFYLWCFFFLSFFPPVV